MSAAVKWHDYLSRALFAARCSRSTSPSVSVLFLFFLLYSCLDWSIDSRGFLHGEEVGNSRTVVWGRSLKTDPLKFFRRFPRW